MATRRPPRAPAWEDRYADVAKMTDRRLVELQVSSSDWHARRARVVRQGRAAEDRLDVGTHAATRQMFREHADAVVRLRPEALTDVLARFATSTYGAEPCSC